MKTARTKYEYVCPEKYCSVDYDLSIGPLKMLSNAIPMKPAENIDRHESLLKIEFLLEFTINT